MLIEEKVEQKYVPSTEDIEASQNGNSSISTARDTSKFTKVSISQWRFHYLPQSLVRTRSN